MVNYKETGVVGTRWTRCNNVNISNPLNVVPTITFSEEEVVDMGDTNFHKPSSTPIMDMLDSNREIALLDPSTGLDTGQKITEGFLYVALFSKYIALATKRDYMESIVPVIEETPAEGTSDTVPADEPQEQVQDTLVEEDVPSTEEPLLTEDPPAEQPAQ